MRLLAAATIALLACVAPSKAHAQKAPAAVDNDETRQRAMLMEFFDATGGPSWRKHEGWGSAKPVCQWFGVNCMLTGDLVNALELQANGLRGTVPSSLSLMPFLHALDLRRNALTGSLPPEMRALVDDNRWEVKLDGNPMGDVLAAVTVQTHAVTGLCYGDIEYRLVVDAVKDEATYEALRCNTSERTKRNQEATFCIRSKGPAPPLALPSRILGRIGLRKPEGSHGRPDLMSSDHDVSSSYAITWGDGTTGSWSSTAGFAPTDYLIAEQTLGALAPWLAHAEAKRVSCDSLTWMRQ